MKRVRKSVYNRKTGLTEVIWVKVGPPMWAKGATRRLEALGLRRGPKMKGKMK